MTLELRQLRYFVAVAETLHFTRAAEHLHISQQPLSAAIAQLERQIGAKLFERTTRRVELTDAGVALLEPAREAIRATARATEVAFGVASGTTGRVSVAMSAGAWYGLGEVFSNIRGLLPHVELDVRTQSTASMSDEISRGDLDLGIGLCARRLPGLEMQRVKNERIVAVVARGHALARGGEVHVEQLRNQVLALDGPPDGDAYNEFILDLCRKSGFSPSTRAMDIHHDAWERAIAAGECIGLASRSSIHTANRGVVPLGLAPPATVPLDLIWRGGRGDEPRPVVRKVIEAALQG